MLKIAHSTAATPSAAAQEIALQLGGLTPTLLLFFASPRYEPTVIARELRAAFPDVETLGCTTAGEIVSGKMLKGSVVAMAMDAASIKRAKVAVIPNARAEARRGVQQALAAAAAGLGVTVEALDPKRHVGMIVIDGLSRAEEGVMDALGDATNVAFVGGAAGDDVKFAATHVFANGEVHQQAAAIVVCEPTVGFDILKTQSFTVTERVLRATRVDEEARTVLELNGKPATVAYAEAVGVAPADVAGRFMHSPVGLMVDGEPFVRSPQQVSDQAIVFYCAVKQGAELRLLDGTDIVADTRRALAAKLAALGQVAGIVNFHCILRTLELEAAGQTEAYGQLFTGVPTVGFSTYGEEYIGHINQTSTMLLLK